MVKFVLQTSLWDQVEARYCISFYHIAHQVSLPHPDSFTPLYLRDLPQFRLHNSKSSFQSDFRELDLRQFLISIDLHYLPGPFPKTPGQPTTSFLI